ncbi:IclR family transcriptional regulator [Kaistia granuli]|uniref:IclR family transcriptional regulator n=1 Tax=Kaistia granuli TaxID=363259 RepID=UPI000366891F|nr:IclR family transcriptional regulator [Kaistia granuli]
MTDERYRVQSLGRALDLLDKIAESGQAGARLTDLARDIGLSKPAAYAILVTLRARGVVTDVGEGMTRRYRLGLSLLRLGDLAVANTGLAEVALPVLRDLTQMIGMTSRVAMMDDGFAVVIGRVDAPGAIRFDAALGRRERPHCSGVGKVLLAAMPRNKALELVERVGHPARTPHTLSTLEALDADLDRIVARHYALDDEEDHAGIICVAAAVFGRGGQTVGAISVTTLKQLLPLESVDKIAGPLVQHADLISRALGGPSAAEAWAARPWAESQT